jgi:metallo-beta-lactamase class B
MFGRFLLAVAAALMAVLAPNPAHAGQTSAHEFPVPNVKFPAECADWDEWDKPAAPFIIYGNTYYVGTCGISAILIVGDFGHILIDGGTEMGADLIAANIRTLGFALEDVDIILTSHEHHDHVGGVARLQELTGAMVLASAEAGAVLGTGVASPGDPQYGMHDPFPAARIGGIVTPGTPVTLGEPFCLCGIGMLELTPIATPGHTPGALSWQWKSCNGGHCLTIVYADSLSPISRDGYRFIDHPDYVAAYREGLERLAVLDCDILLTPHPSASGLRDRLLGAAPLVDPEGCRTYATNIEVRLNERLFEEAGPE